MRKVFGSVRQIERIDDVYLKNKCVLNTKLTENVTIKNNNFQGISHYTPDDEGIGSFKRAFKTMQTVKIFCLTL